MRMDLEFNRAVVGLDHQMENESRRKFEESREKDQRIKNIDSNSDHPILDQFNLLVISNGTGVVGAEEYWKEHTEERSYSPKVSSNIEQIQTSTPIPISSSRSYGYQNLSRQLQLDFDNNINPHPFDPAFSPPYYPTATVSPQTFHSTVDLYSSTCSPPSSSSSTYTCQFTTLIRPESPPIHSYDQHPSINTLNTKRPTYKMESYTPEISEPMRFLNDKELAKVGFIEMSTQTDSIEHTIKNDRGRSRSGSRGRTSFRHHRSSTNTKSSSKRPLRNDHERGRSMSRASTHHTVIMPSPTSPLLRSHSAARHQYQRTPSSSSPSPPLSPSNSFSSVTSLEDTDEELDGDEEEQESFKYNARFIDLPSLRSGLKERDPKNRSSGRIELYCGEKYRLLAINKAKLARTGSGYFNGIFNLE